MAESAANLLAVLRTMRLTLKKFLQKRFTAKLRVAFRNLDLARDWIAAQESAA